MRIDLPKSYSLFESMYGEDVSGEQLFVIKYDKFPSSRVEKTTYKESILKFIEDSGFEVLSKLHTIGAGWNIKQAREKETEEVIYANDKSQIIIKTKKKRGDKYVTINFLYSYENGGDITNQIDIDAFNKLRLRKKKSNISLIKSHGGGYLDLEEYELPKQNVNLSLNYGEEFSNVHKTIISRLNSKNDKGIVLLHGLPGTGKTTYIKYLTSVIENKEVIFVPPSMAEMLMDPSIIPFLMDYKNSILVVEDAEKVLASREGGGVSQSTSNLLNLTDGILGDCLNIQIVATFNTKKDNIDEAFMRKGRLIAEYKFDKLNVESTNILLKHLGKDVEVNEGMVLSDIYNIDVDVHKSTKINKIGFGK